MTELFRYDRGEVKGKASRTDEGYIHADAIVTRSGVFIYQNADGSTRRELRHPDDVFSKASLDTMKMIPITNGHPTDKLVNSDNAKDLMKGSVGENIHVDGQYIIAPLRITHADAIGDVDGGRKELSLGYTVDLLKEDGVYNGQKYDHRQTNIKYNHLAIVDRARAGAAARIHLDHDDAFQIQNDKQEETTMDNLKSVTLDGIDYKAQPEVLNALNKANARADEQKAAADKLSAEVSTLKADADKLKAERDDLKEKLDAASKNDAAIQAAVKARMALERVAVAVLDKDDTEKLDSMSDVDVMKAVIVKKAPKATLDGQTDVYIKARFDAIAEDVQIHDPAAIARQRQAATPKYDADVPSLDKARADSENAIKNAWKGK